MRGAGDSCLRRLQPRESRALLQNLGSGEEKQCVALGGVRWAIACVLPLLLGACAGLPRDTSMPVNDPNEDMNRHVMAANQDMLRPASEFVKTAIPGPVHDRVRDLNSNLKQPRIFVNNVLQARFDAAALTGARFLMNT